MSTEEPADVQPPEDPPSSVALDRLMATMPDAVEESGFHCDVAVVRIAAGSLLEAARFLRDDPACHFELLSSLCGVDMSEAGRETPRFDVVYHLYSVEHNTAVTIKVGVEVDEETPSVVEVWRTANWHERETFDMFGIVFTGHPDLRRILTADNFDAFPLRKDFPLEGREKDHGNWRQPGDDDRYTYVAEPES